MAFYFLQVKGLHGLYVKEERGKEKGFFCAIVHTDTCSLCIANGFVAVELSNLEIVVNFLIDVITLFHLFVTSSPCVQTKYYGNCKTLQ